MAKLLLDSWAWIEIIENGPLAQKILEQVNGASEILTTAINIHESGFRILKKKGRIKEFEKAVSFMKEKAVILDIDIKTALLAIDLREKYKMHASDALCYAAALLNDALIVTGDPDFKNLPKVVFIG